MQRGLTEDLYGAVSDWRARPPGLSEPELVAIEYAERVVLAHVDIDDGFFDRLHAHFDDTEILELSVTIGYCMGIGRVLRVLDVAPQCEVHWASEPRPAGG
jgi:alkylhydroperoxidase family enzyme